MGRQAENSCALPDGRIVGYGLLSPKQRAGYWRVRFTDKAKAQRVELSTGAGSKGEARNAAPGLIRSYFFPPQAKPTGAQWDEAMAELAAVPHLRPATIESYEKAVRAFRRVVPDTAGPADVGPEQVARFVKGYRPKSANTVRNVLRHMSSLWEKHLKSLKLVASNPWTDIEPPPVVKTAPRAPTADDIDSLLDYLDKRYPGWDLIRAFVTVKGYLGCRTMDLCTVRSAQLANGKLHFTADQTKTRTARSVPLPPNLYAVLDGLKGETYLWERYATQAAAFRPNNNKTDEREFTPKYLYWGIGNIFADFNRERDAAGLPRVRPHDLRRRALTTASLRHGVDAAAAAIGVDPQTARRYYVDGQQAHDTDAVYASQAEWWRYGGDGVNAGGAKPAENPKNPSENL